VLSHLFARLYFVAGVVAVAAAVLVVKVFAPPLVASKAKLQGSILSFNIFIVRLNIRYHLSRGQLEFS
jgi:hypothetical protein